MITFGSMHKVEGKRHSLCEVHLIRFRHSETSASLPQLYRTPLSPLNLVNLHTRYEESVLRYWTTNKYTCSILQEHLSTCLKLARGYADASNKGTIPLHCPCWPGGPWVEKSQLKHHKILIQSCDFLLTVTLTFLEVRERVGREIPILLSIL